jgi:hypothetical protein
MATETGQVTFQLPKDTKMPTIVGQWKRLPDGKLVAMYTVEQLLVAKEFYDQAIAEVKQGTLGV